MTAYISILHADLLAHRAAPSAAKAYAGTSRSVPERGAVLIETPIRNNTRNHKKLLFKGPAERLLGRNANFVPQIRHLADGAFIHEKKTSS